MCLKGSKQIAFQSRYIHIFCNLCSCIHNVFDIQFEFVILPKDSSSDDIKSDAFEDIFEEFKDNELFKTNIDINKLTSNDILSYFEALLNKQQINYNELNHKRFIFILNRNTNNENNFYHFIPKQHNSIHKDFIPESLLINSKYMIKSNQKTINTTNPNTFCLSFHCINKNTIKCYQYWSSMISIFHPKYMLNIWPDLFTKINNENQIINDSIKSSINDISTIIQHNKIMNLEL